jgi:hypothetical protein
MNAKTLIAFTSLFLTHNLRADIANAQQPQSSIRYFVIQSTGLFEITDVATGGRFVIAPTSERFVVDGRSMQVRGRTDRVRRGERYVTVTKVIETSNCNTEKFFEDREPMFGSQGLTPGETTLPPDLVPQTTVSVTTKVVNSRTPSTRRLSIGSR